MISTKHQISHTILGTNRICSIRMKHSILLTLTFAAAFHLQAASITTSFTATAASGSIGGSAFTGKAFTIIGQGDTNNRTSFPNGFSLIHDSTSITIADLGTFSFVTGTRIFVNNFTGGVGFSRASGSDLYIFPNVTGGNTWDMTSNFSTGVIPSALLQWNISDVVTSGGILLFDESAARGVFTAEVGNVPEPATSALIFAGLAAVIALRRRS